MFGFSDFSVFNGLVLILLGFVGVFFGNFVMNNFLLWSIASGSLKVFIFTMLFIFFLIFYVVRLKSSVMLSRMFGLNYLFYFITSLVYMLKLVFRLFEKTFLELFSVKLFEVGLLTSLSDLLTLTKVIWFTDFLLVVLLFAWLCLF